MGSEQRDAVSPMRVLFIIPGAIGDFILTLPSIVWISQKLEPDWLEIWAERGNLELAHAAARANQTRALADTGIDGWPPPKALYERLEPFDLVISWRGARHTEWREMLEQRHPKLRFLTGVPADCTMHAMDYRRTQVEALLGADGKFPQCPEILPTEADCRFAREFLSAELALNLPVAIIHPGASGDQKRWPALNFAELARRLVAQGWQVLLCEGPLDGIAVEEFSAAFRNKDHTASLRHVKIDRLMALAAVIQLCRLYVGNDSGISHLAAGTRCPTLAIFTVTNPAIWAPRGRCVEVMVAPKVDQVLTFVTSLHRDPISEFY